MNYLMSIVLGFSIYPISIGLGAALAIDNPFFSSPSVAVASAFIFLALAIILASVEVHRKNFDKYKVPFTGDPLLAMILLTLFGCFIFPVFVFSWLQIVQKKAKEKPYYFSNPLMKR